jgi:hypothetical protein
MQTVFANVLNIRVTAGELVLEVGSFSQMAQEWGLPQITNQKFALSSIRQCYRN